MMAGRCLMMTGIWILRLYGSWTFFTPVVIVLLFFSDLVLSSSATDYNWCCFSANKTNTNITQMTETPQTRYGKLQRRWFAATAQLISETANVFCTPNPDVLTQKAPECNSQILGAQLAVRWGWKMQWDTSRSECNFNHKPPTMIRREHWRKVHTG
jgi:hypothetical protein